MIKQLQLSNWKSFGNTTLWIDPLTFIIGTNSAGKSNIVDALGFLSYVADGKRLADFSESSLRGGTEGLIRRGYGDAALSVTVEIGKEEFLYELSVCVISKELMVKSERLTGIMPDGKRQTLFSSSPMSEDPTLMTTVFPIDKRESTKEITMRRDVSSLSQIRNLNVLKEIKGSAEAVVATLKSIFILDPKPENMRQYTPVTDRIASDGSNIAGVIASLPSPKKNSFEKRLTDYVRPLPEKDLQKIWSQTVGLFNSDAMLYCAEEWVDGQRSEFDSRSMSDGTLRFIAVIATLLYVKEGSTVVIEEVDNGLHPSRAGELVIALKSIGKERNIDIICTTHNPVLIDALGPDMLPFISYVSRSDNTGCSEIHLLEDVPHLLKLLANYTPGGIMTKGLLSTSKS